MSKKLVAYFSASGITAKVAERLSEVIDADLPFATSGGSGMGRTNEQLEASCPGVTLLEGKVFKRDVSKEELREWAEQIER